MLVGFISTYSVGDLPDEERAAYEWLKTSGMSHRFVRFEDLNGTTSKLDECGTRQSESRTGLLPLRRR